MTVPDGPPPAFRFCPGCGGMLEVRAIRDHSRLVCRACGRMLYRNLVVGVAVVVRRGETLLFVRRAGGATGARGACPAGTSSGARTSAPPPPANFAKKPG